MPWKRGARGSIVGGGTTVQGERWRFRDPIRSKMFVVIYLILPAHCELVVDSACNRNDYYKMDVRINRGWRTLKTDIHTAIVVSIV
jgi:hypothetical protein